MRSLLAIAVLVASSAVQAQTPAPAAPAPAHAPARRPAPAPPARGGMAITVTDNRGIMLSGVHVEVLGTSDRNGDTNGSGQINLTQMQPGTYRVRFSGETVIPFEKEVVLRSGQIADLDISLN